MKDRQSYKSYLILESEQFVSNLIKIELDTARYFHGIDHTRYVVENCHRIAFFESCKNAEVEALIIAAWFHDTGYIKGSKNHELESCRIARRFMDQIKLEPAFVTIVEGLIMATQVPTSPTTMLERIICDADMSHLGSPSYWEWQLRLKQEVQFAEGYWMSDEEWTLKNIKFIENHQYYTDHAKALWDDQKRKNLKMLHDLVGKSTS